MSLVKMQEILYEAEKNDYGVGAFSVANMEMVLGAVAAAEELCSPLILQVAESRLKYSPLNVFGPMMVAAAKNAKVPVAVHFDHGKSIECIDLALKLGFTSVMIDASDKTIDENIKITGIVCEHAKKYGATVESEIGQLGISEDGLEKYRAMYSDPNDAKRLSEETEVDAIAVAIGNAHGIYKEEPKLNFDVLRQINNITDKPLVLHGGSGISDTDFKKCIHGGIRKVNVATATFMAVENAARVYSLGEKRDYFTLSDDMFMSAKKNIMNHMMIFGSENRV